jgi:hypothetical protein
VFAFLQDIMASHLNEGQLRVYEGAFRRRQIEKNPIPDGISFYQRKGLTDA